MNERGIHMGFKTVFNQNMFIENFYSDEKFREAFKKFTEKDLSSDNVEFLEQIEKFEKLDDTNEQKWEIYLEIYEKFIENDNINLSDDFKKALPNPNSKGVKLSPDQINKKIKAAKKEIEKALREDVYPRAEEDPELKKFIENREKIKEHYESLETDVREEMVGSLIGFRELDSYIKEKEKLNSTAQKFALFFSQASGTGSDRTRNLAIIKELQKSYNLFIHAIKNDRQDVGTLLDLREAYKKALHQHEESLSSRKGLKRPGEIWKWIEGEIKKLDKLLNPTAELKEKKEEKSKEKPGKK